MKSLVFLSILVLCTACVPQGVPMVEPSPPPIATSPSLTPTEPAATSSPTTIPALVTVSSTPVFEIVIDNLAIGQEGQVYASGFGAYGNDLRYFAQWNGTEWIVLGTGFSTAGNSLAVDSLGRLYAEILTDSQQGMSNAIIRWDGAKWEDITGNFSILVDAFQPGRVSSNIPVAALAVDGEDNLYAAGGFFYPTAGYTEELPMGYVAKWDQETWTVLGQGFDKVNIRNLAVSATGKVYVSGDQSVTNEGGSSYFAQWDGETWTQLNASKLDTTQSIALDKAGRLYAYDQSRVIAYWDGTEWTTITDQLGGEAPVVYDMIVDANGYLYIGGSFESVGGIPARNIAYWDGNVWHALREGTNERVEALAFDPSGELYAVGLFTEAGGVPANHAAYWDGETWYALGP